MKYEKNGLTHYIKVHSTQVIVLERKTIGTFFLSLMKCEMNSKVGLDYHFPLFKGVSNVFASTNVLYTFVLVGL